MRRADVERLRPKRRSGLCAAVVATIAVAALLVLKRRALLGMWARSCVVWCDRDGPDERR